MPSWKNIRMNMQSLLGDLEGLNGLQLRQRLLERMASSEAAQEKFWARVKVKSRDECWIWQHSLDGKGYGVVVVEAPHRHFSTFAHRISYYLSRGELNPNLHVCHRCDTPACVNPQHLFVGKTRDNMKDKVAKNRQAFGEGHGRHRLSTEEVKQIFYLHTLNGISMYRLAKQFNISSGAIWGIVNGLNWKHLGLLPQ